MGHKFQKSRLFLPSSWWKLSFLWLVDLKHRSPPLKSRSLFRQSLRTSVLGMALGVLALSLTLGIVTGFEGALARAVNSAVGTVTYYTHWRNLSDFRELLKTRWPDLKKAESFWTTQGLVVGPGGGRGILIEGRRTLFPEENLEKNGEPISQDIFVDLGQGLAELLRVKAGDRIRILLPGLIQGSVEAKVRKLLSFRMYELDTRTVVVDDLSLARFLEHNDAEAYAKRPGDAHALRFYLTDSYLSPKAKVKLEGWVRAFSQTLRKWPRFEEKDPVVKSWQEQKKNLFGSIGMDKAVLVVVLSLITLVAALNVAATLVVLYLERDRDLAILKALGMSRLQLVEWLGIQGLGVGLLSVLLGLAGSALLGFTLSYFPILHLPAEIYNLSSLPFYMDFREQLAVGIWGLVACAGVSLVLGWRLSRQKSLSVLGYRR